MITSLTDAQIRAMSCYIKKWISIGLSTEPFTVEECTEIINNFYREVLKFGPPQIVIKESPRSCWTYIEDAVGQKMDIVYPYTYGQFDASVFSFYDYCKNELPIKIDEELWKKFLCWQCTSKLGIIYMFDDIAIVSMKPTSIKLNSAGQLHNEDGPAITFADGIEIYSLNGVSMKKEFVMTPWDQLDCNLIITEQNAEVRRELIRKIGIERVIDKIGAEVIDKKEIVVNRSEHASIIDNSIVDHVLKYELLIFDIGDGRKRPFLKMINPSIGTYHIEGVHPDCKTVDDALEFRNGTKEPPIILT